MSSGEGESGIAPHSTEKTNTPEANSNIANSQNITFDNFFNTVRLEQEKSFIIRSFFWGGYNSPALYTSHTGFSWNRAVIYSDTLRGFRKDPPVTLPRITLC